MQDLIDGFTSITYKQHMRTMGCMVSHIHLDINTFNILFQKGTICTSLLIILFDSDCVHIYVNKLITFHKTARVVTLSFLASFRSKHKVFRCGW
jgi:hypothetical protein